MSFTVLSLFENVDLDHEDADKHRSRVGDWVKQRWDIEYNEPPKKTRENSISVNYYPEKFRAIAQDIFNQYAKIFELPIKAAQKD